MYISFLFDTIHSFIHIWSSLLRSFVTLFTFTVAIRYSPGVLLFSAIHRFRYCVTFLIHLSFTFHTPLWYRVPFIRYHSLTSTFVVDMIHSLPFVTFYSLLLIPMRSFWYICYSLWWVFPVVDYILIVVLDTFITMPHLFTAQLFAFTIIHIHSTTTRSFTVTIRYSRRTLLIVRYYVRYFIPLILNFLCVLRWVHSFVVGALR